MNILHLISKNQEVSTKLKKLQAACDDAYSGPEQTNEAGEEKGNEGASSSNSLCPYDKEELKKRLNPTQFRVTQQKGTERQVIFLECQDFKY